MQKIKDKPTIKQNPKLIIDADNAILGRVCSEIAKYLLEGYSIDVINVEKVIISGKKASILREKLDLHKKHTASNPTRGPFHQKRPDRLMRRTVRGMLPMKKNRGRSAYHRLRTHISVPENLENKEITKPKYADASKLRCQRITLGELCQEFGWKY